MSAISRTFLQSRAAAQALMLQRGYKFDRHEDWNVFGGVDLYRGETVEHRGQIHLNSQTKRWVVSFYSLEMRNENDRV